MRRKIDMPNIPALENAVIALNIDLKKKKEHIIIGDFDDVNRYIRGSKANKVIFEEKRPIGSFLLDVLPDVMYFSDIKANFCDTSKEKLLQNIATVENIYEKENPLLKYMGMKLWQEYLNILKADKEKNEDYPALERMEDMTLPFRYNLMSNVLKWQKTNPFNPLVDMPYEYFKYSVQTFIVPDSYNAKEYAVSDFTLLPLIVYYLKTIYENKKYFSYCKVCGKLFLAPDVNKTVICSDKCRKTQQKINKQKYDNENRDVDYERTYRNEKMYWYNRIQKAKKKNLDEEKLKKLQSEYAEFKRVANIKKNQVKIGLLSYNAFDNWYLDKRDVVDYLMLEYGIGKYE